LHARPDEHAQRSLLALADRARRLDGRPGRPPESLRMSTPPPAAIVVDDAPPAADPCRWCGARGRLLWLRSHVQCEACGQVVESCSEGPAGCA
jgi:hypothetical protein